jgi:hypothetical protein
MVKVGVYRPPMAGTSDAKARTPGELLPSIPTCLVFSVLQTSVVLWSYRVRQCYAVVLLTGNARCGIQIAGISYVEGNCCFACNGSGVACVTFASATGPALVSTCTIRCGCLVRNAPCGALCSPRTRRSPTWHRAHRDLTARAAWGPLAPALRPYATALPRGTATVTAPRGGARSRPPGPDATTPVRRRRSGIQLRLPAGCVNFPPCGRVGSREWLGAGLRNRQHSH